MTGRWSRRTADGRVGGTAEGRAARTLPGPAPSAGSSGGLEIETAGAGILVRVMADEARFSAQPFDARSSSSRASAGDRHRSRA